MSDLFSPAYQDRVGKSLFSPISSDHHAELLLKLSISFSFFLPKFLFGFILSNQLFQNFLSSHDDYAGSSFAHSIVGVYSVYLFIRFFREAKVTGYLSFEPSFD